MNELIVLLWIGALACGVNLIIRKAMRNPDKTSRAASFVWSLIKKR